MTTMSLTSEQLATIREGGAVPVSVDDLPCVLIRRDAYDRAATDSAGEPLPADVVARLVAHAMAELDAGDPLLDSYQKYRHDPTR